jgi:hypothetical protein
MRIALLDNGSVGGRHARQLADALRDAGHDPRVLGARPSGPAEALLRRRGFAGSLTSVPCGVVTLVHGGFHVAHAFSTADALTGLMWRRLGGGPVVFTSAEPLQRDRLADRRLGLWLLQRAAHDTDALIAATEESRAALARWLALDAPVIDSHDAAEHERLYRELLTRRT